MGKSYSFHVYQYFSNRVHGIILGIRISVVLKSCSSPLSLHLVFHEWVGHWGSSHTDCTYLVSNIIPLGLIQPLWNQWYYLDVSWGRICPSMCKMLWSIIQSFCPSTAALKMNWVAFCNHVNYWLRTNDSHWNLGKHIKNSSVASNLSFPVHGLQQDLVQEYNRNVIP